MTGENLFPRCVPSYPSGMELDAIRERPVPRTSGEYTPAAVLIPLIIDANERMLLFTRRAPDLDDHPGQISFPGGRQEAGDTDLVDTALREAHEEIGLEPSRCTLHGSLDPIITVTGFEVIPFLGEVPNGPYERNPSEVAEILSVPVEALLDERNYEAAIREHPNNGETTVHYFTVDGTTIWGATARILVQLLELTYGWQPPAVEFR